MTAALSDTARTFSVKPDDDGIRLDRWFKRNLPDASFNLVSRWARTGQLRVDGKRAEPGDRVTVGQSIRVPPADANAEPTAKPKRERPALTDEQLEMAEAMVIYRDSTALVLNKPPGLATQGGTKTDEHVDGLLDALWFDADMRPKLVHRLDKDTSGALLIARSTRAAAHFSKAFAGRTARKVYWALVMGTPSIEDGVIDLPLSKQPGTGGEKMHVDQKDGAPSRTRIRVIDVAGNRTAWVECQPLTGRTHQIRVHLAAIGHPIIGDGKYGGREAYLTGEISRKMHLHARRIRVDHPNGNGEQVDVTAPLPLHFAQTLENLGFEEHQGDDLLLDEVKFSKTPEGKKRAVVQKAKAARKSRKGERRRRGQD